MRCARDRGWVAEVRHGAGPVGAGSPDGVRWVFRRARSFAPVAGDGVPTPRTERSRGPSGSTGVLAPGMASRPVHRPIAGPASLVERPRRGRPIQIQIQIRQNSAQDRARYDPSSPRLPAANVRYILNINESISAQIPQCDRFIDIIIVGYIYFCSTYANITHFFKDIMIQYRQSWTAKHAIVHRTRPDGDRI